MKELKIGCGKPTGATVGEKTENKILPDQNQGEKEIAMSVVRVGQKAPDFEAPAYQEGKFGQVKLSDYFGNGLSFVFTREILPLSEPQSWPQLRLNTKTSRTWGLKYYL